MEIPAPEALRKKEKIENKTRATCSRRQQSTIIPRVMAANDAAEQERTDLMLHSKPAKLLQPQKQRDDSESSDSRYSERHDDDLARPRSR